MINHQLRRKLNQKKDPEVIKKGRKIIIPQKREIQNKIQQGRIKLIQKEESIKANQILQKQLKINPDHLAILIKER